MKTGTLSHKAKFILVLDNGLFSNAARLKDFQIKLKSGLMSRFKKSFYYLFKHFLSERVLVFPSIRVCPVFF